MDAFFSWLLEQLVGQALVWVVVVLAAVLWGYLTRRNRLLTARVADLEQQLGALAKETDRRITARSHEIIAILGYLMPLQQAIENAKLRQSELFVDTHLAALAAVVRKLAARTRVAE